jgi:hypothetical protein
VAGKRPWDGAKPDIQRSKSACRAGSVQLMLLSGLGLGAEVGGCVGWLMDNPILQSPQQALCP